MKEGHVMIVLAIVVAFTIGAATGSMGVLADQEPTIERQYVMVPVEVPLNDGRGYEVIYPEDPSYRQSQLLGVAYDIAKKDGHEFPQLLQGILIQETQAGSLPRYKVVGQEYGLGPLDRYYGIMQIKLSAAWDVMKRWPGLWDEFDFQTRSDEEIIAKLIEDEIFSLTVASKYLIILQDAGYETPAEQALAYNRGAAGAKAHNAESHPYSVSVMAHMANRM